MERRFLMNQKTIDILYQGKSVRLDVYVEDNKNIIYNAEMQNREMDNNTEQLPKRSRYYQGMIDLNLIEKGMLYEALNNSYVIFICTFDPFGLDRYQYTFQNICIEEKELLLNDEAIKVFFNTKGNMKDAPEELRKLLQYIETKQPDNELTRKLDAEVERAKKSETWRREYMKEIVDRMDIKQAGVQEGIKQGEQRMNRLIVLLTEQNRTEDLVKAAKNEAYQKQLFEEFGI